MAFPPWSRRSTPRSVCATGSSSQLMARSGASTSSTEHSAAACYKTPRGRGDSWCLLWGMLWLRPAPRDRDCAGRYGQDAASDVSQRRALAALLVLAALGSLQV